MKIAIIGSRNLSLTIDQVYNEVRKFRPTMIVSGGARGIDTIAKSMAYAHNIQMIEFLPNYKEYGKSAPFVRNRQIVENSDVVVGFWDGQSKGTKYTLDYARKRGKKVIIFNYNKQLSLF